MPSSGPPNDRSVRGRSVARCAPDLYNSSVLKEHVDAEVTATPAVLAVSPALAEKLDVVQPRPGVYLLKDKHAKVIYVGKAVVLRSR